MCNRETINKLAFFSYGIRAVSDYYLYSVAVLVLNTTSCALFGDNSSAVVGARV